MITLADKIIISTRPLTKNDSVKEYLTEKGAKVLDFPMIEICTIKLDNRITNILQNIITYQWIVFTSKNGVESFYKLLKSLKINTETLVSIKIAVIGKKTSEEVRKNNCEPFFVSKGNTSEDFLHELSKEIKINDSILLPLGELAADTLEKGLTVIGPVNRINVYKTSIPKVISQEILEIIIKNNYNLIVFTSPSGVKNFKITMKANKIYADFRIGCIGKTTEKQILKYNFKPLVVSSIATGENFAKELETFFITNKI